MNLLAAPELVREIVGGESYDYYHLGKFVVIAPGVCGGRPTFKYTRLEVGAVLALLSAGFNRRGSCGRVRAEQFASRGNPGGLNRRPQRFTETSEVFKDRSAVSERSKSQMPQ